MTSGQRTRVAFVTQWFPPEPTPLPEWIARSMAARGLDVHVITGFPNYPSGVVMPGYSPRRTTRDDVDGLRITRAPLIPGHGASAVGRALNYTSFAAGSAWAGRHVLRSADVALVYASPITAAASAQLWRTPYVVMVQDLWPDSVTATGFVTSASGRSLLDATLGRYSLATYRGAAHVCVISPGMRDLLVDRGVEPERISVVYNWVDETVLRPGDRDHALRRSWGAGPDDLVLLYAGTMGPAQALDTLVAAMERLRDRTDIHLVLVGDGITRAELQERAHRAGLDRVSVHDPVAVRDLPRLVASADLNVVSLADEPLFRITFPSKIQATLACGGPLFVVATGDAAAVTAASGAGVAVAPGDPLAVAEAVRDLADGPRQRLADMRGAARAFYLSTLSETINADVLVRVLRAAAGQGRV